MRWLHSSIESSVRWRSGARRPGCRSTLESRSSRSAICATDSTGTRAAASSIARGIPSSQPQTRRTLSRTPGASGSKWLDASIARSRNSKTAPSSAPSSAPPDPSAPSTARPPTRHTCSPGTPSGWRLVAITRSDGDRSSSVTTRSAHASTTCSQLSSTRRIDSGTPRASATGAASVLRSRSRMVAATAWGTSRASKVLDRSTHQAPPTKSGRIASASAMASRVFPAPPGPHRVSTRVRHTSERSSASAASRPTSLVSWTGRFPCAPSRCSLSWVAVSSISQGTSPPWHGSPLRPVPGAPGSAQSLKTGAGA